MRLGMLSLLVDMDLTIDEINSVVSDAHKRQGFIEWIKGLDRYYPVRDTICVALNKHSVITSIEIRKYFVTKI